MNPEPTTPNPLRVAIWCAVSSKPQAQDEKTSLQDQEDAGRQFARALDALVVRVYAIPGHSRDIIFWHDAEAAIPAYRQLRQDVEARAFDILHAIDPDRLGRDPALSNQVLSLVEKSGAEVYFATAPHVIGQKGTGARYVFAIQSTRAGEDQQRRVQYHARGMAARRARGLHPNNWPHGYAPTRDQSGQVTGAQFDQEQLPALRLITSLFLQGQPYAAIARALEDARHPPPRAGHRPVRRSAWDRTTIRRILTNPTYAGRVPWSGQPADQPSDAFPALWDPDTHAAIQRELQHRDHNHGRRTTSRYGHVAYCARCGHPMERTTTGGPGRRQPALQCSTRRREGGCHRNTTHEAALDQALAAYLHSILDETALDQALAAIPTPGHDLRAQLDQLDGRILATNQKRQRLANALAAGALDPAMYRQTDDPLLADLVALNQKRAQLLDALNAIPDLDARRRTLTALRDHVDDLLDLPPAHANALLRHAGLRILCDSNAVTLITLA